MNGGRFVKLCELGQFLNGKGLPKADLVDDGEDGTPCLRYAEVYTKYGDTTVSLRSRATTDGARNATKLLRDDIVFAASGETAEEIGMAVGYLGHDDAVVGGDTVILRGHEQDTRYLSAVLNSHPLAAQKAARGKGHSVVHIHAKELGEIEFWLHDRQQQQRIAAILDAWDDAIAIAERLVLKRERGLRAARHRVIIGPLRKLIDTAGISFSGVDKKIDTKEQPVALCNYMHIWRNNRLTTDTVYDDGTATKNEINRFSLREGDFIFTKDSETAAEIAEVAYVADTMPNVVCGYHLALARPKAGFVGSYLAQAIRLPSVRNNFATRANGAIRFGLTLEALSQISLPVPDEARQRIVADYLDAAESAIKIAREATDALRRQKRGLLQKLLTGEWPVPKSIETLAPGGVAAKIVAREVTT